MLNQLRNMALAAVMTVLSVVLCQSSYAQQSTSASRAYDAADSSLVAVADSSLLAVADSSFATVENLPLASAIDTKLPLSVAIKTNALLDAVLIPNLSAEILFGEHVSLSLGGHLTWIHNDSKAKFWQTYGGEADIRYWLANRNGESFTGHNFGIYSQVLTYDFEFGKVGNQSLGASVAFGAQYGYSFRIARDFRIDLVLGAGYLTGLYQEYLPVDDHFVWQATKRRMWFGPTKAEASIIWILPLGKQHGRAGSC